MIVGFTGTQDWMTAAQRKNLRELLKAWAPSEFHHGDCIGADAEAHQEALDLGIPIVLHPPSEDAKRAFCDDYVSSSQRSGTVRKEKPAPYLDRNRAIVAASDRLIAAPTTIAEQLRSGTWATVRYARQATLPVVILAPDGTLHYERLEP